MIGGMEMIKTYPPEVDKVRADILKAIDQIREGYEAKAKAPMSESLTALQASRELRTPRDFANLQRDYQMEIEPFVRELVRLEGFASTAYLITEDQRADLS